MKSHCDSTTFLHSHRYFMLIIYCISVLAKRVGIVNRFLFFIAFTLIPFSGITALYSNIYSENDESYALAAIVSLDITADPEIVTAPTEVTYTYTVTNKSDAGELLTGITVTDDDLGAVTLDLNILEPLGTASGTLFHAFTQEDIDAGVDVVNTATVTSDEGATAEDKVTVSISQNASVSLDKSADKQSVSAAIETITYTYEVANIGNVTLTDVTVTDDKLGFIALNSTTLSPGDVALGNDTYDVLQQDINAGTEIVNEATVTTAEGPTADDNLTITVIQEGSVTLVVSPNKTSVSSVNEIITYTYEVTNNGNVTLTDVSVDDVKVGPITLNANTLLPAEVTQGTGSYTVTQTDFNLGDDIVNVATVTTAEGATQNDDASVSIIQNISVSIEKTADKPSVSSVDEIITYTYEVTNDGNVTLTNITVTDDIVGAVTLDETTLIPGGTAEGTKSYTVSQADINSGENIVNVVTVTTTEGATDNDNASVSISQDASVLIEKTANKTIVSSANEIITYTYEVTNDGNITLTNVSVSDDKLGAVTLDETTLIPGGVTEGTKTYTVTQADINSGESIVNVATVTSTEGATDNDNATVSISQDASVSIEKTANKSSVSSANEIITYTYEVTNTGNTTLTNVSVSDDKLGNVTLDETTLTPGGVAEGSRTYTVTQADINSGDNIVNIATVTTTEGATDNDNATVSISQDASVLIEKTADKASVSSANEIITYTYEVTNNGNTTLTSVSVSDDKLGAVILNATTLTPGGVTEGTKTYTVTQADINSGDNIVNVATVTTAEGATDNDNASVSINQQTGLTLSKTAAQTSYNAVGQEIEYTLIVENTGNVTLTNVTVSDPLTGLDETIASLAAGASQTFNESYTITQADLNNGSLSNTASASGTGPDGIVNDSDAVTISATQTPGLTVTKLASPATFGSLGDVISYSIEVENTGNVTLTNITVTDPLIGLNQNIASLGAGQSQTYNGSHSINQTDLNNGSLTNTASASGTGPDGTVNDSDVVTVNATQRPGLSVTKLASLSTYNSVGEVISYNIEVENTGNVALTNVKVTDPLIGLDETFSIFPAGSSETFNGTYTITQNNLNAGSLTNTAYAVGNDPDGIMVSDSSQVVVSALQISELTVVKNAAPSAYSSVGDIITYTITVENTGNVRLTNVTVSDPLLDLTESISALVPGADQIFTEAYLVTQEDIDAGSITNTVNVSGTGPDQNVVIDTDNVTVNAGQSPALAVSKTALQKSFTEAGEIITYVIEVENNGNVSISDITVSDPLAGLNQNIVSLNPGESRSYSPTYTIVQADVSNGNVINTVNVSAVFNDELIEVEDDAIVSALLPPVANDDISTDNISGNDVVIDILANDRLSNGSQALPGLVTVDLNVVMAGIQTVLQVPAEGVWSYNVQSGEVTFSPASGFTTDPTSVEYTLTEKATGLSDNAVITAEYNEGEPFAFNDISSGHTPGESVTINILANDKLSDGTQVTIEMVTVDINIILPGIQSEVIVPDEGRWIYNGSTGNITFTPVPGFSTDPTPLTYSLTENMTGLRDNGTVIISYTEIAPFAFDDVSTDNNPGDSVIMNILENDKLSDRSPVIPALVVIDLNIDRIGIQNDIYLQGIGTFVLNPTSGIVTFSPEPGFTGTTEPLPYRLTEILTGLNDTATITIGYAAVPPVASDDSSEGNEAGTQVSINILENDVLSDGTPATPQLVTVDINPLEDGIQNQLVVAGQGTWSYNTGNGILSFTPLSVFYEDPTPLTYILCSIWNPGVCDEAVVSVDYDQGVTSASIGLIKKGIYSSDDDIITYSFEVTNTGNIPVWDIIITDSRIGITNLSLSPDTLLPGANGTAVANYKVTQEDKNQGSVTNTALASGSIYNNEKIEDISGSTVNDDVPTVTYLLQNPSVSVEKEAILFTSKAILNEVVDFRIVVTNNGNVVLLEVMVTDSLTGFEQDIGQMLPGASVDYITQYTVQPEDELNGKFENTVVVTGIAPGEIVVTDSSTVIVEVEQCEMVIPTGFSPNDDGIQDTWRIKCLEKYPEARIEIFNRWGNRVFEKESFGNTDIHGTADAWWDGYSTNKRTFGSGKLPTGTYYYILYLHEGQEPLNGFIFLNR
jgi:gliding motility-associated-like protein/uncharacterized repeat protein (TIGR01451 family)